MSRSRYPGPKWRKGPPQWYTNMFIERPNRRETKRLIQKVLKLIDLEDTPLFPLPKRPDNSDWY